MKGFLFVIPHSEVGDKPERGIGETHSARGGSDSVGGAGTLNGPSKWYFTLKIIFSPSPLPSPRRGED